MMPAKRYLLPVLNISTVFAACAAAVPAYAEDEIGVLDTVYVTAGKQKQRLDQVNGTVKQVSADVLSDNNVLSTADLPRVLPNVRIENSGSFLFPVISVRGVTSAQDFYNPAVTVYVDGIPQIPVNALQSLENVEKIELLSGPQGTLYGKSAQGGIINITTHRPDNTPRYVLKAGASTHKGYQAEGTVSGPLIENLLYGSVTIGGNRAGNTLHNDLLPEKIGGARSHYGNIKLRLAPENADWETGLTADRSCTNGKQDAYTGFDDITSQEAYIYPGVPAAYRRFKQKRCATSLSAYAQYDFDRWRLFATAADQRVDIDREFPLTGFSQQPEKWRQNIQEIRLFTRPAPEGKTAGWDAVFGLYRQQLKQERTYLYDMWMPAQTTYIDSASQNRSTAYAAYGNITKHITEKADIGAGIRWTHDEAKTVFAGEQMGSSFSGSGNKSQNTVSGNLSAGYMITPAWRVFANVAQGYKPTGFNLAPSNPADAEGYGRERSVSYEIGSRYLGTDLKLSAAVYQVHTRDAQLYGDNEMGYQTLRNMGNTRSTGIEFDALLFPQNKWSFGLAGFLNKAKFTRLNDAAGCTGCTGNDVPATPRYSITASVKGTMILGSKLLRPQVSLRRTGAHYFDIANTLKQDAYTVVDAAVFYNPTPRTEFSFFVNNLTDKAYRTYAFSYGALGNFAQTAPRRSFGMTFKYEY